MDNGGVNVTRRADLDSTIDRALCAALVREEGAALFEGWSDAGSWTIALPCPREVREIAWDEAARWHDLVRSIEPPTLANDPMPEAPFLGGWVGYVAYDAGAMDEAVEAPDPVPPEPAAWFARHDSGLLVDSNGVVFVFGDEDEIEQRIRDASIQPGARVEPRAVRDSMSDGRYAAGVESIRNAIRAGDVYQVNLTRRFEVGRDVDPSTFHLALTGPRPPRCSALLAGGAWTISSASPEVFLEHDRRRGVADSRPIKGTIRRAGNDAAEIAALLESQKDASEHLMIVDLVRNDLGKVAPPGRVSVPTYRTVRTLGYVHHLESTVEATGLEDVSLADVMRALFPGGSITGAPKRAAVQMIRRLEPVARGVYTGAIGFVDDRGRSAFSVAIRTAVIANGAVRYHAGGGIVWDSDPGAEDHEAIVKAEPFLRQFADRRDGR